MSVSMYMGKPLHGEVPVVSTSIFDTNPASLASSYVTSRLNTKMLYGLTDKNGDIFVSDDGNTIHVRYDDGSREHLVIEETDDEIRYTVSVYDNTDTLLETLVSVYDITNGVVRNDVTYAASVNGIPSFDSASWKEISALLEHHYNGEIDLTKYWHVGDIKTLYHDKIYKGDVNEEHEAGTVKIVILGTNHDTLSEGSGTAAFTIGLLNSFGVGVVDKTLGKDWINCDRRSWCNSNFLKALPKDLQNMIKTVSKSSYVISSNNRIGHTNDKVFILSESEIMGTELIGPGSEGDRYPYFSDKKSMVKYRNDNTIEKVAYATRTLYKSNSGASYVNINSLGKSDFADANTNTIGIVPAFCI